MIDEALKLPETPSIGRSTERFRHRRHWSAGQVRALRRPGQTRGSGHGDGLARLAWPQQTAGMTALPSMTNARQSGVRASIDQYKTVMPRMSTLVAPCAHGAGCRPTAACATRKNVFTHDARGRNIRVRTSAIINWDLSSCVGGLRRKLASTGNRPRRSTALMSSLHDFLSPTVLDYRDGSGAGSGSTRTSSLRWDPERRFRSPSASREGNPLAQR